MSKSKGLAPSKLASKDGSEASDDMPSRPKKKLRRTKAAKKKATKKIVKHRPLAKTIAAKRKNPAACDRIWFLSSLLVNGPFEIRILGAREHTSGSFRGTKSGYFTDFGDALDAIREADKTQPKAIYVTLNPVVEGVVARAHNRLEFPAKQTTKDAEIERRSYMLVDIDPRRPTGVSANDEEVEHARRLAEDVRNHLNGQGWPEPISVFSGSGRYLIYGVDLPNDEKTKKLVNEVLHSLAKRFDTANAVIDTSVFNASRLVKIPGTWARKGDEKGERKHRIAAITSRPQNDELKPVSGKQLQQLATRFEKVGSDSDMSPEEYFPSDDASEDVVKRCLSYLRMMNNAIAGEGGHNQTFAYAAVIARFGLSQHQAIEVLEEINAEKCKPVWSEKELRHKLGDAYVKVADEDEIGKFQSTKYAKECKKALRALAPETVAESFANWLRDANGDLTLRIWKGGTFRWRGGRYEAVEEDIQKTILRRFLLDGFSGLTARLVSDVHHNVAAMISLDSYVQPPQFLSNSVGDTDKGLFRPESLYVGPTKLINLATGEMAPNTAAYFSLSCNAFDYQPGLETPKRWLKFLNEVFADVASRKLVQEWMGYLLTADISFQKMMLLHGPTRSGKGTISRIIESMVGHNNFCAPTFDSFFDRFGLAPLVGKTVAIVNDARRASGKKNDALTEKLLSLSGGDQVQVDRKYRDSVSMRLQARLMILSNEIPRIDDASGVIADRFLVLRTQKSFLGMEDRELFAKLAEELPQIICWAVEGWKRLNDSGKFTEPSYTSKYREQIRHIASPVTAFVAQRCTLAPNTSVTKYELFRAYELWCAECGIKRQESREMFGQALQSAYPAIMESRKRIKGERERIWKGICRNAAALLHTND